MDIDFDSIINKLRDTGYPEVPNRVHFKITNAENLLRRGLSYFTGGRSVWNEQNYRPIVDWMENNNGRGLLLAGDCGLGKTLIGMRILPIIINVCCRLIVNCYKAQELNEHPDEVMSGHLIYIDDIGTENISNIYGNKRVLFSELVDLAEQKGKLLIISTNYDIAHLADKYGVRTVDRLRAITKYIPFTGQSLRK